MQYVCLNIKDQNLETLCAKFEFFGLLNTSYTKDFKTITDTPPTEFYFISCCIK